MKRKGGVPSDVGVEQKKKMQLLSSEGYTVKVAYGADDAWGSLCDYLGIPE